MVAKIARSSGERRRNAIKISRKEISRPSRSIRVEILICPDLGEEKLARGVRGIDESRRSGYRGDWREIGQLFDRRGSLTLLFQLRGD